MDLDKQTRRQFCGRTCQVAAVAAVGGALATTLESCGGGGGGVTSPGGSLSALPTVAGTASTNTIVVSAVSTTALAAAGALVLVRTSAGDVLVAHTGQDAYVALSAGCTHQSCEITGVSGQLFVCPCHGSEFDTTGRVVSGPAPTGLRQYTTVFAGDVLTITA
jgi:cytochrome b6-f complex iron-sulfur subunit